MKKTLCLFVTLFAVSSSSLFAALPPLSQSTKEVEAIVKELPNKLNPAGSLRLIKHEQNSYIILTTQQKIKVDVVYEEGSNQAQMVGPQKFTLVFHEPESLDHGYNN